jgi:hypothetical protein
MEQLSANRFSEPATPQQLDAAARALAGKGINAHRVDDFQATQELVLRLIPEGSSVMNFPSVTLEQTGVLEAVAGSGRYDLVRRKLDRLHGHERMQAMRRLTATPQVALGSCNAVTEPGDLLFGSALGSQLGAYAYGADKVVLVVGAQKLVADLAEALERMLTYALPLEDERARAAYGQGSRLSKILTVSSERSPERFNVVLLDQPVGF